MAAQVVPPSVEYCHSPCALLTDRLVIATPQKLSALVPPVAVMDALFDLIVRVREVTGKQVGNGVAGIAAALVSSLTGPASG